MGHSRQSISWYLLLLWVTWFSSLTVKFMYRCFSSSQVTGKRKKFTLCRGGRTAATDWCLLRSTLHCNWRAGFLLQRTNLFHEAQPVCGHRRRRYFSERLLWLKSFDVNYRGVAKSNEKRDADSSRVSMALVKSVLSSRTIFSRV